MRAAAHLPRVLLILVAGASIAAADPSTQTAGSSPAKGSAPMNSPLTQLVLRKDRRALLTAKQLGPSAQPELEPLATNADPDVRELAIAALDESASPASKIYAAAVLDSDNMVQIAAIRALNHHPDPAVASQLAAAYPSVQSPTLRGQVALAIGRTGKGLRELTIANSLEKDPRAQEGCVVALAKLGDDPSKVDFVQRWFASAGPDRGKFFDYAAYIHERWLLKPLLHFLNDTTPALRIGVDARPELPHYLRSCDLAVNLIADLTKKQFSFPTDSGSNYTPPQIDEVRQYTLSLPEAR